MVAQGYARSRDTATSSNGDQSIMLCGPSPRKTTGGAGSKVNMSSFTRQISPRPAILPCAGGVECGLFLATKAKVCINSGLANVRRRISSETLILPISGRQSFLAWSPDLSASVASSAISLAKTSVNTARGSLRVPTHLATMTSARPTIPSRSAKASH